MMPSVSRHNLSQTVAIHKDLGLALDVDTKYEQFLNHKPHASNLIRSCLDRLVEALASKQVLAQVVLANHAFIVVDLVGLTEQSQKLTATLASL